MKSFCRAGIALAMLLIASTISAQTRTIDFEPQAGETPVYWDTWNHHTENYFKYEASFQGGIRALPQEIAGQPLTSSVTYMGGAGMCLECEYLPVRISFNRPVKNVSFKLTNPGPTRYPIVRWTSDVYLPPLNWVTTPLAPRWGTVTINIPAGNIRQIWVDAGYWDVYIDDFTYTVDSPSHEYAVTAQIQDGTPGESKYLGVARDFIARVPLGLEFTLALQNKGQAVAAVYTLGSATFPQPLPEKTLYPKNVTLEYDRGTAAATKTFRAVHLGSQALTITPSAPDLPSVSAYITAYDPGYMGSDVQYDAQLVDWGNRRGIPPYLLKGLVRQEGPFNPFEYRYEIVNTDTGELSFDYDEVATDAVYSHYRLATEALANQPALSQGDLLRDYYSGLSVYPPINAFDDISPRRTYDVLAVSGNGPSKPVPVTPLDVCPTRCVSARALFEANDGWMNWSSYGAESKSYYLSDEFTKTLEHTAQTPLAASYGLMQLMYRTAIDADWSASDGSRNPSLLFDTVENWAIGAGSLAAGTLDFYKSYRYSTKKDDLASNPDFLSPDQYRSTLIKALNWYNHGSGSGSYGVSAWNYATGFKPQHCFDIFE